MKYPHTELLTIIRTSPTAAIGYPKLLALCQKYAPDPVWKKMKPPNPAADAADAANWLSLQLEASKIQPPIGIYLGLDTLNQDRGATSKNVEMSTSPDADPDTLNMDWAYERRQNWYGANHLIKSLVPMKRAYERSNVSTFADYVLFLGYSSLVLAEALDKAAPSHPFLAVCGFHDGDIFYLAHRTNKSYQRIVKY